MGTPPSLVKVKKPGESTRFLGVWISLRPVPYDVKKKLAS